MHVYIGGHVCMLTCLCVLARGRCFETNDNLRGKTQLISVVTADPDLEVTLSP